MKEVVINRDIYDKHGRLLIAKGSELILTLERYQQLQKLGVLDDIKQSMEKTSINDDSKVSTVEDMRKELDLTIQELSTNLKNIDYYALQKSTDTINRIIFECKDEEWHRFVLLICSYMDFLYTHSLNTALISCLIGSCLGYNDEKIFEIGIGALLHDIGLTLLPKKMLLRVSELTDTDLIAMKNHCEIGYATMKEVNLPEISKQIILQHHERLDGSGYPNKLEGNQINEESMITIIAEYFDMATTTREDKVADPINEVIDRMYESDNLFSRQIVSALKDFFIN